MASIPARKFDLAPVPRALLLASGAALTALVAYALLRAALGLAPDGARVRDAALAIHLGTVIPSLPLGLHVFLMRKGGARHRLLGRIWSALMATTAVASFFLRGPDGGFSFIHIFSVLTLVGLPVAILAARRGNIAVHRAQMLGLFVGAVLVAGLFTFIPGRLMHAWAFG